MTNLEILKKAFETCGYDCEFEEEDGKLTVLLHIIGCSNEFVFSATYTESVDLDYVISTLKTDFNYSGTVNHEEGWFVSHLMETYIQEPEQNGTWACEGIINTWKLELNGLDVDWGNFSSALEERLNILQESYEVEAEYGIDWDEITSLNKEKTNA